MFTLQIWHCCTCLSISHYKPYSISETEHISCLYVVYIADNHEKWLWFYTASFMGIRSSLKVTVWDVKWLRGGFACCTLHLSYFPEIH